MAAGDELVYRLILDSQDNTSGNNFGSGSSRQAKPASDDPTTQNVIALEQARAKIRREDAAELMDQQYRSLKRSVPLTRIQDEDHQKKLDDAEAEAERVKAVAREEAERQRKAADRIRIQGEERQNRDEDWLAREDKRIQREKATQQLHGEERQNRDEDWLARDQLRQRNEAMAEAERQRKQAESTNPVHLANLTIERDKLYEQTRLQVEATKRGMTPEEVAEQERRNETARQNVQIAKSGGSAAAGLIRGNVMSAAGELSQYSQVGAGLFSVINPVLAAVKQNSQESRQLNQKLAMYSPELARSIATEDVKDAKFQMQLAKEQGSDRARLEAGSRALDRAEMKTGTIWQRIENTYRRLQQGLLGGSVYETDPITDAEKMAAYKERELERAKAKGNDRYAATLEMELANWRQSKRIENDNDFMRNLPSPMAFQVDRKGPGANRGNIKIPFMRPQGLANPQMPGG